MPTEISLEDPDVDPDVLFGQRLWQRMLEEEPEFDVLGKVCGGTCAFGILEDSCSEVASEELNVFAQAGLGKLLPWMPGFIFRSAR